MLSKAISAFPGLNGIRAIAAYSVLIYHCIQISNFYENKWPVLGSIFSYFGQAGLILFFVLSGFLITYLLLQEQDKIGKIDLIAFYKRRVLRIFPLYYLIVALSVFFLLFFTSHIPQFFQPAQPVLTLSLFLFLLPNLALMIDYPAFGASHLWSLGAENQFYLIWPLLIIKCKKYIVYMISGVILLKWTTTYFILPFFLKHGLSSVFFKNLNLFLYAFPLESMAMGGLGAWFVHQKNNRILHLIFNPLTQILAFLCTAWFLYNNFGLKDQTLEYILLPFAFLIIIMNVSCNSRSFLKLESSVLNYLGKISYGIYMFHPIVIFMNIWFFNFFKISLNIPIIFLSTAVISTLIATFSFYFFESPFLRIKNRDARIEDTFISSPA